eukprot:CAMPEP_0116925478 /NCGR_PEP_ID=MMETSP0467-20121206/24147_1 /TAXON_ID=283647 /ORGANISM="Mesodinium pulex, Strain SPMC105" /LENGTH=73 /DNA_ID=CAMNT_0004604539 /DNA_START=646 /DNA_END=867 /DNA_ORIENTATION=+
MNTLIESSEDMSAKDTKIKTFSVIPLSNDSALLGFIGNCDQISSLIKNNRQNNGYREQVEMLMINKDFPNFEK